jgi:hypothetical protein
MRCLLLSGAKFLNRALGRSFSEKQIMVIWNGFAGAKPRNSRKMDGRKTQAARCAMDPLHSLRLIRNWLVLSFRRQEPCSDRGASNLQFGSAPVLGQILACLGGLAVASPASWAQSLPNPGQSNLDIMRSPPNVGSAPKNTGLPTQLSPPQDTLRRNMVACPSSNGLRQMG